MMDNFASVLRDKIRKANVFCDVRHHGRLYLLCSWVLANKLLNQRIVHRRHMHLNMRLMVLVEERFDRFAL